MGRSPTHTEPHQSPPLLTSKIHLAPCNLLRRTPHAPLGSVDLAQMWSWWVGAPSRTAPFITLVEPTQAHLAPFSLHQLGLRGETPPQNCTLHNLRGPRLTWLHLARFDGPPKAHSALFILLRYLYYGRESPQKRSRHHLCETQSPLDSI